MIAYGVRDENEAPVDAQHGMKGYIFAFWMLHMHASVCLQT